MGSTAEVARNLATQIGNQVGPMMPAELLAQLALVNAVLAVADQIELLRSDVKAALDEAG